MAYSVLQPTQRIDDRQYSVLSTGLMAGVQGFHIEKTMSGKAGKNQENVPGVSSNLTVRVSSSRNTVISVQRAAPGPKSRDIHLQKYRGLKTGTIYLYIHTAGATLVLTRASTRWGKLHSAFVLEYKTGFRNISPLFQLQPVSCFSFSACGHHGRGGGYMAHDVYETCERSYNSRVACSSGGSPVCVCCHAFGPRLAGVLRQGRSTYQIFVRLSIHSAGSSWAQSTYYKQLLLH